eukprot:TRINITY_DN5246_c0_g1_i11.p1 TRINITY_DN5246_c0_g1~~TRINITY_DN5246_c0_g1_i11.p1  ORF type:complete len:172 (-),score=45.71 TRINITY_DN5246_c0_g1_i11:761-1276(-)
MTWADGSIYIGEWKEGIQHGYGRMYFPDGTVKEGLFANNIFKGTAGLESYDAPKELLDKTFDIMRYGKDMKFSDEILGKRPIPKHTSYSTSAGRGHAHLRSTRAISVKPDNKFIIHSSKMSENDSMEQVNERIRKKLKRRRFKRRKLKPKGEWIPAGKPNYANIARVPGGI